MALIRPVTPLSSIQRGVKVKPAKWQTIVDETRRILDRAIAQGGTTIINFVQFSGKSGYFQNELLVYGRDGQPCPRCQRSLTRSVMAGRATFFCGKCQK